MTIPRFSLLALLLAHGANAFTIPHLHQSTASTSLQMTGGWGIGQSRELTDGEMARGERQAFDGYALRDRGEFMRQIKKDRQDMARAEVDELLGVAEMAGIKVKNPSERLNKFDPEDVSDDDDDDLDVSVQWDDDVSEKSENDESITRMDEDTGAPGVW